MTFANALYRLTPLMSLIVATSTAFGLLETVAVAQSRFSEIKVDSLATGEEIARQPGLWVMEVYFKPLRMIAVDVTNPVTGKKEPKFVWYIVYRAINRPLASPTVTNPPVNEIDAPVLTAKFIPEFELETLDGEAPRIFRDQVIPEALAAINQRERRTYKNAVTVVQDVPEPLAAGQEGEKYIYGVAMFTGIDADADRYRVYMTGFSNGVQISQAPDGSKSVLHKTIETNYWRPGDRFDQQEPEIRFEGSPRWIYR